MARYAILERMSMKLVGPILLTFASLVMSSCGEKTPPAPPPPAPSVTKRVLPLFPSWEYLPHDGLYPSFSEAVGADLHDVGMKLNMCTGRLLKSLVRGPKTIWFQDSTVPGATHRTYEMAFLLEIDDRKFFSAHGMPDQLKNYYSTLWELSIEEQAPLTVAQEFGPYRFDAGTRDFKITPPGNCRARVCMDETNSLFYFWCSYDSTEDPSGKLRTGNQIEDTGLIPEFANVAGDLHNAGFHFYNSTGFLIRGLIRDPARLWFLDSSDDVDDGDTTFEMAFPFRQDPAVLMRHLDTRAGRDSAGKPLPSPPGYQFSKSSVCYQLPHVNGEVYMWIDPEKRQLYWYYWRY